MGEALLYQGRFRKLRVEHQGLLSCLLNSQGPVVTAAPTAVSHTRKEYSFLKPNMVNGDCDKKELTKFINEARIWLNKTITEDEKKEEGMIFASLRSGLVSDWTQIPGRTPSIERMTFDDMSFLEKHPLVIQRINSLRITKDKDESISKCMRRIYNAYLSAELDKAPLETLMLLHLLILFPSDPLSEKVKSWLVEKMRQNSNIDNLDEVGAYILSQ